MRRTVSDDSTQTPSTAMVSGRLPVASNARNPMVMGPPMIAVAIELMPTTAIAVAGTTCAMPTRSSAVPRNLPIRVPRNREAKNRPPRKPEAIEVAVAQAFISTSSPSHHTGNGVSITIPIAPWPDDRTIGVESASTPMAVPPMAGRSQPGMPLRRSQLSSKVTPRMMAMPIRAHSTPTARIGT